jgi:hypothetical protein
MNRQTFGIWLALGLLSLLVLAIALNKWAT